MNNRFAKAHGKSDTASRITVILVDDSALAITALRTWLGKHLPLRVVGQAADGLDGFELASRLRPDLVITDLRMPRCDGLMLVQRLHETFPAMKLIIASSDDGPAIQAASRQRGADAFIPKNRLAEDLADAVSRLFPQTDENTAPDYLVNVSA
jgi:two-component system, response regulator YesN